MRLSFWLPIFMLAPHFAAAQQVSGNSDYYIRSEYPDGGFFGSHEILQKPKPGYFKVNYCEETFWVSFTTVVWTQKEVEEGRVLQLEKDVDDKRVIVCNDEARFPRIEDLNLSNREMQAYTGPGEEVDMKTSRIKTIRDAFSHFK